MAIMALSIMPSFKSMTIYFNIYGHHGFDNYTKFQEHDNFFSIYGHHGFDNPVEVSLGWVLV